MSLPGYIMKKVKFCHLLAPQYFLVSRAKAPKVYVCLEREIEREREKKLLPCFFYFLFFWWESLKTLETADILELLFTTLLRVYIVINNEHACGCTHLNKKAHSLQTLWAEKHVET